MRTVLLLVLCVAAGCSRNSGGLLVEPEPGPVLRVIASYPGASAQVVADTVAAPLEHQINGTEGLMLIESESCIDGSYVALLRFKHGTSLDEATTVVQKRIAVGPVLPEVVRRQGVTVRRGDADRFPPVWIAVTSPDGTGDAAALAKVAGDLKNALARVPGITDIRLPAPTETAMRVWLDPDKMAAYSLTTTDVVDALRGLSLEIGTAGGPKNMALTLRPKSADAEKLQDVIVKALPEGRVVRLKDVARVEFGAVTNGFARLDDRPAALVAVVPADDKALDAAVEAATKELNKLPKGLAGDIIADVTNGKWSLIEVRFPYGMPRERAEKHAADVAKRVRAMPDLPRCVTFAEDAQNVVRVLAKIAPKDAGHIRTAMEGFADVRTCISDLAGGRPFPVRIALTDEGGHGLEKLREWADAVAKRLEKEGVAVDPDIPDSRAVPQMYVDIDREKLATLGLKVTDVTTVLQTAVGGLQVDDFNKFGRTLQIRIQGVAKGAGPDDLKQLKLRNDKGEIIPLGTVVAFRSVEAPTAALRVNQHPALRITAAAPEGKSVTEVTAKCVEIAEAERKALKLSDHFKVVNLVDVKPR